MIRTSVAGISHIGKLSSLPPRLTVLRLSGQ
jgi:hypothetical protein